MEQNIDFLSESFTDDRSWFDRLDAKKKKSYLDAHPKSKFQKLKVHVDGKKPDTSEKKTSVKKPISVKKPSDAAPVKKSSDKVKKADPKSKEPTLKDESKDAKAFFVGLTHVIKKLQAQSKTVAEAEKPKLLKKIQFFKKMLSERGSKFARSQFRRWKKIRGMQLVKMNKQFEATSAVVPSENSPVTFSSGVSADGHKRWSGLTAESKKFIYDIRVLQNSPIPIRLLNQNVVTRFPQTSVSSKLEEDFERLEPTLHKHADAEPTEQNVFFWKIKEALKN